MTNEISDTSVVSSPLYFTIVKQWASHYGNLNLFNIILLSIQAISYVIIR